MVSVSLGLTPHLPQILMLGWGDFSIVLIIIDRR